jgi:hypothetical protein
MSFYVQGQGGAFRELSSGNVDRAAANTRGEQVVISWEQQMVQAGRVFMVSNAARETALAMGGTSFSDTAPAFAFDVPNGITAIPLKLVMNQGGTVAGGVITCLITNDNKLRISSTGTVITSRNMRNDVPRASVCIFDVSPTAAGNALDSTLWAAILDQQVGAAASVGPNTRINWPEPGDVAPVLYGPASLVVYTFASTPQPSWFFSFKWAEFETGAL